MLFVGRRNFLKLTWFLIWGSLFSLLVAFVGILWEPLFTFGFLAALVCLYAAIIVEVIHMYFGKD